jgi:hypothetical protein
MAAKTLKSQKKSKNVPSTKTVISSKKKTSPKLSVSPASLNMNNNPSKPQVNPWWLVAAVAIVLALLTFQFKDKIIVATVNGQPITYAAYVQTMEEQVGQEALDQLILEQLILQEADRQTVTVPEEQIDAEVDTIRTRFDGQDQSLEDLLVARKMTMADLRHQIKMQSLLDILASSDNQVTDEDIEAYIADNKDSLPDEADLDTDLKTFVRGQLEQQQSQENTQTFIENLRQSADVNYW